MDSIYVGNTTDGQKLALPNKVRTGHVQIVGATGRGKTESVIYPWLVQDMIHDRTAVLIDGKGDRELLRRISECHSHFKPSESQLAFLDLSSNESFATNPLLYGTPQQITDRLFSTFVFEKEYFKNVSYEAAFLVVRMLRAAGEVVTFRRIRSLLADDGEFTRVLGMVPDEARRFLEKSAREFLRQPLKDKAEKLSGLMAQITPFSEGEAGRLVNGSGGEENFFSLTETLVPGTSERRPKKVVLILIPELLYQETARRLGKMLLQEVAYAVGVREATGFREFASLFLDEFGSFVYPGFIGLLNKARSTNTAIHLSHQSTGDMEAVSREFAKSLHTNTNVKCVLGVNDPDSADFFAKHFGTFTTEKKTERATKVGRFSDPERTGEMSLREVEEYKIHPNRLRNYSEGRGVLSLIHEGHAITEEIQFARSPI